MTTTPDRSVSQETIMLDKLQAVCRANEQLEIAVLIGSRATGYSHKGSDWDIAIQWHRQREPGQQFGLTEQFRHHLAEQLKVDNEQIDLIDIPRSLSEN